MRTRGSSKPFAKKSLGQNFLADADYIARIIAAVSPAAGDVIVEIGPGRGALTRHLVESGANVIAIELDRDMIELLKASFGDRNNFRVIERDVLEIDLAELIQSDYLDAVTDPSKLVANLPYYISTAVLQKLIARRGCFSDLVLMFQREVVERITAAPGSSERGFLTVLVEAYFSVERLFDVPPEAFRPRPKVWSSVVRLKPKAGPNIDPEAFRSFLSSAFGHKRKTIMNNLKTFHPDAAGHLTKLSIDPSRRPETLTLDEWIRLAAPMV